MQTLAERRGPGDAKKTLPEKCTLMHDTGRPRGERGRRRVCDRRLVRGAGGQAALADKATFERRPEEVRAGAGRCPREAPSGGASLGVAHVGSRTPPGPASRAVCVPAGSVGGGEIRAVVCVLIGFCAQNRRGGIGGRQGFTAISQTREGRLRGGARELEPGFVLLRGSLAEPRDRSRPRGRGVPLPRPRPHLGPHARAGPVRPVGQLGSRHSWEWGRLPHLPDGRSRAPGSTGAAPAHVPPLARGERARTTCGSRASRQGAPQDRWLKARGAGSPGGRRRLQPLAQDLKGPKLHVAFERQAAARQGRSRDQQHQPPLELEMHILESTPDGRNDLGLGSCSLCLRRPSR